MGRSPHSLVTYEKSPGQKGREALREQETYDKGAFRHDYARQQLAALQSERAQLIAAGVSPNMLPEVHPNMSPQDIKAVRNRHNQLFTTLSEVHPGQPGAPAAPQAAPSEKFDWFNSKYSAVRPPEPHPASPAAGSAERKFTVPATRADGTQMKNFDLTPRTIERTPRIAESNKAAFGADFFDIPHEAQAARLRLAPRSPNVGVTTSTGTSPWTFDGHRQEESAGSNWQTTDGRGNKVVVPTGGVGTAYDPTHDMTLNRLSKGDPLLPKGATSGLLVPGSLQTGDFAYTAPPMAAKPPTVGDTRLPDPAAPDAFAALTPKLPLPAATAPTPAQNASAGIGYSAMLPRPNGVTPQPGTGMVDARKQQPADFWSAAAAPKLPPANPLGIVSSANSAVSPRNPAIGSAQVITQGQKDAAANQSQMEAANNEARKKAMIDSMYGDAHAKADEIRKKQAQMQPGGFDFTGP